MALVQSLEWIELNRVEIQPFLSEIFSTKLKISLKKKVFFDVRFGFEEKKSIFDLPENSNKKICLIFFFWRKNSRENFIDEIPGKEKLRDLEKVKNGYRALKHAIL